jgi:hypothetical protein
MTRLIADFSQRVRWRILCLLNFMADIDGGSFASTKLWSKLVFLNFLNNIKFFVYRNETRLWSINLFMGTCTLYASRVALPICASILAQVWCISMKIYIYEINFMKVHIGERIRIWKIYFYILSWINIFVSWFFYSIHFQWFQRWLECRKADWDEVEQSNVELALIFVKDKWPMPQKIRFLIFQVLFYSICFRLRHWREI